MKTRWPSTSAWGRSAEWQRAWKKSRRCNSRWENLTSALKAYNDALKIRQEIGAKKEAGDTLNDLGDFYLERGQPDKALQMFKESLQIQRDAGDETNQALCLSNIGTAYLQKSENEDALTYLQQALQIREKLNVPSDLRKLCRIWAGRTPTSGSMTRP